MACTVRCIEGRPIYGHALQRRVALGGGIAGVLMACLAVQASAATPPAVATTAPEALYGKLPLHFEPNQGQSDPQVQFLARGPGYILFLTSTETVLGLHGPASSTPDGVLRMQLLGTDASAQAAGEDRLPGKVNYFLGQDPSQWRTGIPTYAKVSYDEVYPGIDVVYYGKQGQLEYDLVVAPAADPNRIRLTFQGTTRVPRLDAQGDLVLPMAAGEVRLQKPVLYQEVDGRRQEVAGRYVLHAKQSQDESLQVGFEVADYDRHRPLIIDPVLVYSTYLGGSKVDVAYAIAVDGAGSAYITGDTGSADFPTLNSLQDKLAGRDAFITKLTADGSALVYSTFLGGSTGDHGYGIAVDGAGQAYVTGFTESLNFPLMNALQPACALDPTNVCEDAFVTKLNANGSVLAYSTYLGGTDYDTGFAIAVDGSSQAYVTGYATSTDFPTKNALDTTLGGLQDAFVTKLSADGAALVYSTYRGGSGIETGAGIAVDATGQAYVTGLTTSDDFPVMNPLQQLYGGNQDAFVTKLTAEGTAVLYSTYLGGGDSDAGAAIAVDGTGQAYVTGNTQSANFPLLNALQPIYGGNQDAFVTKLTAEGAALAYSTYLGGNGLDAGTGIAVITVNEISQAYVTGLTASDDFLVMNSLQELYGGVQDAFVAKLCADGTALYSTYLGGSGSDEGTGIAAVVLGGVGQAYVTGKTASTNFPVQNALLPTYVGGLSDGFVTRISD